jgi:hypothetical protein
MFFLTLDNLFDSKQRTVATLENEIQDVEAGLRRFEECLRIARKEDQALIDVTEAVITICS